MDDEYETTTIAISQSVTDEKIDEAIQSLKSKLLILDSEVRSLISKENPLFIEMAESYIKLKQIDLENAEKWKENSQIMAKLLCDTEIQANEENFNINKEKLDLRAKMLIKYKFEKLMECSPDIAEYFHNFEIPFFEKMEEIPSFPDDDLSNPPIYMTKEPLLNGDDISQDLSLLSQQKPKAPQYIVTQKSIKCGKISFQQGMAVNVILPESPPIDAIIQNFNQQLITLKVKGSENTFTISLLALNSGIVSLKKF